MSASEKLAEVLQLTLEPAVIMCGPRHDTPDDTWDVVEGVAEG